MTKETVLKKLEKVTDELKSTGDTEEVDWLSSLQYDLKSSNKDELSLNFKEKLAELIEKCIAPRGFVDTDGQLDMATWVNLLTELAEDVRTSFNVK